MALPHTLTGIIGFLVAVLFLVGVSINQDVTNELNDFGQNMQLAMNSTQEFGVIGQVAGFGLATLNVGALVLDLLNTFPAMLTGLPPEGQLFFVFMVIFLIIAVVKLINGVWDY